MSKGIRSYKSYIETGQLTTREAAAYQATREAARSTISGMLKGGDVPVDAVAFGALDVIAVKLVGWYGAAEAGEVFRHYAGVCERQTPKPEESQS